MTLRVDGSFLAIEPTSNGVLERENMGERRFVMWCGKVSCVRHQLLWCCGTLWNHDCLFDV